MKKLTTAATLVAGALMLSQTVQAGVSQNNLYMGFQNAPGSGFQDYIINLGDVNSLIGSYNPVDLSSYFSSSLFNSAGLSGTNSASIVGGVVGGSNSGHPSDLFATQLRSGGAGIATIAGSSAPVGLSRGAINASYADLTLLTTPTVGTGLLDSSKSWEAGVENGGIPQLSTFFGDSGVNPDSTVSTSTVLYEDLWETSNSKTTGTQPFSYEGYFTLDLTGANPSLTFTPAPEPSSNMISAAGGILVLLLRSRSWQKKA